MKLLVRCLFATNALAQAANTAGAVISGDGNANGVVSLE